MARPRAVRAMCEGGWKHRHSFVNEEGMFNPSEGIGEQRNPDSTEPENGKRMRTKDNARAGLSKAPIHLPNPDYKPRNQIGRTSR